MRNKELVKALDKIAEGITDVRNLLVAEEEPIATAESKTSKKTASAAKKAKEPEVDMNEPEEADNAGDASELKESLMKMKYNELKKYAKEVGVDAKGTRDDIIERIMNADNEDDKEEEPEESPKKPAPRSKTVKSKKTEEPEPEEDEVNEEFLQTAREFIEEEGIESAVEVLTDVGIPLSARDKKKKDVVAVAIAKAIADGLIEADDEDEGSEEDGEEVEMDENAYFPEYDVEGVNDPEGMTDERLDSCKALVEDIINRYSEDELTAEDMTDELEDLITTEESELIDEDSEDDLDLLKLYIEVQKRTVDDDGEIHEPGDPYEIDGENFCCGRKLRYNVKAKTYSCAVCGEEYEAD